MATASIITIGDELLIGQVIDTNSAFIAQELNKAGFRVARRVAVGDVWDEIWAALDQEQQYADIILITGGLGPTADDITKPLLCQYFGGKMIVDQGALDNVKHIFETLLKRPMIARNLKQAEVPDVCTVIQNKRGTAPGMCFEKNNKIFISMPGVPFEMQGMVQDDVIGILRQRFPSQAIVHKTLLTANVGESFLADLIQSFEEALPAHVKLAYLPNFGMVRLRLTGTGSDAAAVEKEMTALFDTLQSLVKDYLVTNVDETMEKTVARLLLAGNKTVGTAESCTGGYISHLITAMPGSSAYYKGSVIAYAYDAKENLLSVDKKILETRGAVSEEVVTQMVKGAVKNLDVDYAIAVSGIMGPGGETPDKPVGTVWIGVGDREKVQAKQMHFRFDRMRNIQLTAMHALNMLRQFIIAESGNIVRK